MANSPMFKKGDANKRKGKKVNPKPKAPHDPKTDGNFGNMIDYGYVSKTKGMNKSRSGPSKVPKHIK